MTAPPRPTQSIADKPIGEFAAAGFTGHNPFPSTGERLAWAHEQLRAQGARAGIWTLAVDLNSGELVLLLGKEYRRQTRAGANLEALGHCIVMKATHATLLGRLNSSAML